MASSSSEENEDISLTQCTFRSGSTPTEFQTEVLEYMEVSNRFRGPISATDCQKFEESWVSDASRRKWNWTLNLFEQWRLSRNEAVLNAEYSGEPILNKQIEEMSEEELDFFLARFVAEVKKEDGQEYPGKTIYEMIGSLQAYFRFKCKRELYLIDKKGCKFRSLNSALNFVLKDRAGQGLGIVANQAKVITPEQIECLWEKGFLGSDSPELLRDTLVFVLGINFALRAGQEHRNLRMQNSQLSIQKDDSGEEYLQYVEDVSKTNDGGLAHLKIKRKIVRAYRNVEKPERCPVEFYKKYLQHVPKDVDDNSFYLRALKKPKGDIWYYKKAAGRETLGNVVRKIMKNAGFEGHFTNHSLRRSCATQLYETGVPEQIIQETTGHRSVEGVRAYKRTSSSMKRKISAILQGVDPVVESSAGNKKGKVCETDTAGGSSVMKLESKESKAFEDKNKVHKVVKGSEQSSKQVVISTDHTSIVISYN